jgi:uncharacterized Zn finger protein
MPGISELYIRSMASPESYRRGVELYEVESVVSLVQRGDLLLAGVIGSQGDHYDVQVLLSQDDVKSAVCSCPYDWGGWCKHIVAALLAYRADPDAVEHRPPLAEQLAPLAREQLLDLILNLVGRIPGATEVLERQVSLLQSSPPLAAASTGQTPPASSAPVLPQPRPIIDPKPWSRQVREALHSLDRMRSSEAYWQVGSVVNEVSALTDKAVELARNGEAWQSLLALEAITEAYLAGWETLDDSDGEASEFFAGLGRAWAEAILHNELTTAEREDWLNKLDEWEEEISGYGMDEGFEAPRLALQEGWDDPTLLRALRGEASSLDAAGGELEGEYEDEFEAAEDLLTPIRLAVLGRQQRYDEYLRLATAANMPVEYLLMLIRLGRSQEAAQQAEARLRSTDEALVVVRALDEHGEGELALQVAQHSLTLPGPRAELAAWVSERARAIGRRDLALSSALIVFEARPDLHWYQAIQGLAGPEWSELQPSLLAQARKPATYAPQAGAVEILLQEQLWDDAIAAVNQYTDYVLLERIVETIAPYRPDWTIKTATQQAERIMDAAKSQSYTYAARWLKHARTAYLAAGRQAQWSAYLAEIKVKHARKRNLMPLLAGL